MQQAEKISHGAEFKDRLQMGQLKDLLDLLRHIHQLEYDSAGTSPRPHVQQHSQATRIDAVNLRQVKHQHPGVGLTEYRVAQCRIGVADHNSALAPENPGVSQFLNGYLKHDISLAHT